MNAIGLRREDDRLWTLSGDLSLESVPRLLVDGTGLWREGAERCVDLAGVGRIDSAGVALLLEWQRQARRRKVRLTYRNVPRELLSIAEVCGVRALLPVDG